MTPEESYLAIVAELQALARNAPHVTQADILEIASMPIEQLRRRAIVARDWHGHFAHSLDGIKEISAMPGSGIDGCRSHKEVRAIVEQLVARCPYTWEDNCYGRLKAGPAGVRATAAPLTDAEVRDLSAMVFGAPAAADWIKAVGVPMVRQLEALWASGQRPRDPATPGVDTSAKPKEGGRG